MDPSTQSSHSETTDVPQSLSINFHDALGIFHPHNSAYVRLENGETQLLHGGMPRPIGIIQVICGFVTTFLSLFQLFVLPLALSNKVDVYNIRFDKASVFGFGLWAGSTMVLSGSAALRAYISHRASSIRKFFALSLLSTLIHVATLILFLLSYSENWIVNGPSEFSRAKFGVHTALVVVISISLLVSLLIFVLYFKDMFCSNIFLGRCRSCCASHDVRALRQESVVGGAL